MSHRLALIAVLAFGGLAAAQPAAAQSVTGPPPGSTVGIPGPFAGPLGTFEGPFFPISWSCPGPWTLYTHPDVGLGPVGGSTDHIAQQFSPDTYRNLLLIRGARVDLPATRTFGARLVCQPVLGDPTTVTLLFSATVTYAVGQAGVTPPPGTPGGPTLEEINKRLEAACNEQRAGLQEIARLNNEMRDLLPTLKLATEVVKLNGEVASVGSKLLVIHPPLSAAYKWASYAAKATELYGKYTAHQMEEQIKHWDRVIVDGVTNYESTCQGITFFPAGSASAALTRSVLPTWTDGRAGSATSRAVAAKGPDAGSLLRNAKAELMGAKKLNRALRTLTSHLTKTGAPAADVAAVRKQASAAVKLIANDIRLRQALARKGALKHRRLRARNVPRSLRRNPSVRKFINKPLANILAGKDILKAERALIAVLRAQPTLP